MAVTTRSPLRLVGACVNSGAVNTGEQRATYGGGMTACIYSGMVSGVGLTGAPFAITGVNTAGGADLMLWSGPGRLKDVLIQQTVVSGQQTTFYDGATPTSGGPFVASGHRMLGVIPPGVSGGPGVFGLMGSGLPTVAQGQVLAYDIPFHSGLIVNMKSGGQGFTVTFSPEVNPAGIFVG
jgi:hypothetical protein